MYFFLLRAKIKSQFYSSGYVIEKRDLSHGGGWVPAVSYVNPKYNHSPVPRLLEGTKYEFRVCAENLQGRSDPLTTDKPIIAKNQFGECYIYFLVFSAEYLGLQNLLGKSQTG
jgi:hypothetical protein